MSESNSGGGKLASLRQQARQSVASTPGRVIGEAARAEIQPVMDRLDQMTRTLNELPTKMETAASSSAMLLREGLTPMLEQVSSLRTSLETLPTLLSQQTDGVLAQIQAEGQSFRTEIERLKGGLRALPDALAKEVAPIILMAERLDQVLEVQRKSLAALHEESMSSFRAALDPTAERIETSLGALKQQAQRTGGALQGMKALPKEIRVAVAEAKTAGVETAEAIRQARGAQWHPAVQMVTTAVLSAALILGGLVWLGTHGSKWLPLPGSESAKEQAWDSLYQANPQLRQGMDSYLANSARK